MFSRIILMTALAVFTIWTGFAGAQEETKEQVFEADKGPDVVDVSGYPAPVQSAYKVFSIRCTKCHTLARPINTDFTNDKWARYVKRMMRKPGSGISNKDAEMIAMFLQFDNVKRKGFDPKKVKDAEK